MASSFLQEIGQVPEALRSLAAAWEEPDDGRLARWRRGLSGVRRVVALGMGTSSYALDTMAPGLARAGVAFHSEEAGEWLHADRVSAAGERLVLCSQSGASAEIVRLLERGVPPGTVGVTNDPASPLGGATDPVFLLRAGAEAAISTKTYAATLATGHLLGAAACGDLTGWLRRVRTVAAALESGPSAAPEEAARILAGVHGLAVIGRTHAAPAVRQLALTLAEGAGLLAVPFVGGSFRHGPMEACGPRSGVVAFAGTDAAGALVLKACADASRLGSPVVLLTDRDEVPAGCVVLRVPAGEDAADFSLRAGSVQARLVEALARARGRVAGVFQVNSKVTVTE